MTGSDGAVRRAIKQKMMLIFHFYKILQALVQRERARGSSGKPTLLSKCLFHKQSTGVIAVSPPPRGRSAKGRKVCSKCIDSFLHFNPTGLVAAAVAEVDCPVSPAPEKLQFNPTRQFYGACCRTFLHCWSSSDDRSAFSLTAL